MSWVLSLLRGEFPSLKKDTLGEFAGYYAVVEMLLFQLRKPLVLRWNEIFRVAFAPVT
jgi:hypothetical protein